LGRCLEFEIGALSDIIDTDLGLCLDSIFTNEMQIEVGHRVKLGHSVGIKPTARLLE
jgi:hypothetical protein